MITGRVTFIDGLKEIAVLVFMSAFLWLIFFVQVYREINILQGIPAPLIALPVIVLHALLLWLLLKAWAREDVRTAKIVLGILTGEFLLMFFCLFLGVLATPGGLHNPRTLVMGLGGIGYIFFQLYKTYRHVSAFRPEGSKYS